MHRCFFQVDDGRVLKMSPYTRTQYEKLHGHAVTDSGWQHYKFTHNFHEFADIPMALLNRGRLVIKVTSTETEAL